VELVDGERSAREGGDFVGEGRHTSDWVVDPAAEGAQFARYTDIGPTPPGSPHRRQSAPLGDPPDSLHLRRPLSALVLLH
jgi:hypothetical protein